MSRFNLMNSAESKEIAASQVPTPEIVTPDDTTETTSPAISNWTSPSDRYYLAATLILILGIVLRQWALATASMHPDENVHIHFASGFANYVYDPIYHGPLLYHLVAPILNLAGQNEFTVRLVPSVLGIALIAFILWPMREFLGNRAALAAGGMIAVSPSIVTYSRRLLHDSLALMLTMGAVWCFLTALNHPANTDRGRYARIGVLSFLTLFLATKANCFFIIVMLGAFYVAWWLSGRISIPDAVSRWIPPLLFAAVNAAAIYWPRDNDSKPAVIAFEHRQFTIIAVLCCFLFGLWLMTRTNPPEEREGKRQWQQGSDLTTYVLAVAAALWIYVILYGNVAQVLIQWGQDPAHSFPKQTFLNGAGNARLAISKMLAYWGGQQKTPRLPSRHDYYLVLALLYEIPILLVTLGGIWHAAKKRSVVTDLLLWWSFSSWTVYALANEKVPWLLVHSMVPMAMLGAIWLGQLRWKPAMTGFAVVCLLFAVRGVSGVNFERGGDHAEPMLYAQTPELFSDTVVDTLRQTQGDNSAVWLSNERQWPTLFYLRTGGLYVGKSGSAIGTPGVPPSPNEYRACITQDEIFWPNFKSAGWTGKTVDFLVWSRASWTGLQPQRYFRWFWTRDTLPLAERNLPREKWKTSILAGKGEWSHVQAVIGQPERIF